MPITPIPAKLEPPRIREGLIPRAALTSRLAGGLEGRVTLVSAPAGYGKSTIVAQWLAESPAPRSAWLSLDAQDSDLERFTSYLIAALRKVEAGCLTRTEALLSGPILAPPAYVAETMAAELADLESRVVLVLDDYGVIRDEGVHELIRSLVPRLSDRLHVAFLTRVDPPLPLGLWRTRGWLNEMRGLNLRFSRDEAGLLFETTAPSRLSHGAIDVLHEKTEGWIAGLRLAQLSLDGAPDPEARVRAFSGTDRLVIDYLMEETLAAQPPEVREFLAVTAPLDRFCADLCDHLIAGQPGARESRQLLDRLYRHNVFLFPLGPLDGWYRYHHLFRQLLLDRAGELLRGASRADICRRAGEWFAREGWIEEGFQLLLEGGDVDRAADVLALHLNDIIDRDLSRRTLARWLAMFPKGAERNRLPLIVASAYMMILRWDPETILRLIGSVEAACGAPEGDRLQRWRRDLQPDLDALRGYALYWTGDVDGAVTHTAKAIAASTRPHSYQQSLALLYQGAGLALAGKRSDYLRFLDEGLVAERVAGGVQVGPYMVVKASVHLYRAELDQCQEAAREILAAGTQTRMPNYWRGIANYLLGTVAYERDLLTDADAHFRAVEAIRFDTSPMFYHHALLGLARVNLAQHDTAEAQHWADAARDYAIDTESSVALRDSEWFDRGLALAAGQWGVADWSAPTHPDFMRLSIEAPTHTWAWLQLLGPSSEGWAAALQLIEAAHRRAEEHGVERHAIQLSVLRAIGLEQLGHGTSAVDELEAAVRRAEPHRMVRSFLDRGARIRGLLHHLAKRSRSAYVEMLLRALETSVDGEAEGHRAAPGPVAKPHGGSPARPRSVSVARLTNREVEVLQLLQQRLTNKEIAGRLSVTPETVRKHTLNIYQKLGVHGRRPAVAEAAAMGILGSEGS